MTLPIGFYDENDPAVFNRIKQQTGVNPAFCRAANWYTDWDNVTSNWSITRVRDSFPGVQAQMMSIMWPYQFGVSGSKDGWTKGAAKAFNSYWRQMFDAFLAGLPAAQTVLYVSTSYETSPLSATFWYNSIALCGSMSAYQESVRQARLMANDAEAAWKSANPTKTPKKIVLAHNPVNLGGEWASGFVVGSHGAIVGNFYAKPEYMGGTVDGIWDHWLNQSFGLKSMVALARANNAAWGISEVGIMSDDRLDMRPLTQKLGDFIIANKQGLAFVLPWISDRDYAGNVYAGRSPKAAEAMTTFLQRLNAEPAYSATTPAPTPDPTPPVVTPPVVTPPTTPPVTPTPNPETTTLANQSLLDVQALLDQQAAALTAATTAKTVAETKLTAALDALAAVDTQTWAFNPSNPNRTGTFTGQAETYRAGVSDTAYNALKAAGRKS